MSEPLIPVPGRLHSVATEGHLAGADEIIDENIGEVQSVINMRYDQKLDLIINDIDQSRELIIDKLNDIEELEHFHYTSYIIDQSNPIGLSATYIRKNTASKDAVKTIEIDGEDVYVDVIKRIRENTKLCVGVYDSTNDVLKCKEVSKADRRLYSDDTQVSIASSDEYDMFMKLPAFYWRCVEADTDVFHVEFSMSDDYVDDSWHYWDGDTFIGVYKGYVRDSKLYSKPGVTPSVDSYNNYVTYVANRPSGYSGLKYVSYKIMALLGFGWFNDTDITKFYPVTSASDGKLTGQADQFGIEEGVNNATNYWGLEEWYNGGKELIDNIYINNNGCYETLPNGNTRTILDVGRNDYYGSLNNIILGENADVLPSTKNTFNNTSVLDKGRAYTDYVFVHIADGGTYRAGKGGNNSTGWQNGLLCIHFGFESTTQNLYSRLQYKGNYEFVESFV